MNLLSGCQNIFWNLKKNLDNENWTAWEPVRLNFVASEPECFEKRELEVKCTDPTKNNVTQIAYNDTCSDPFDVTTISELCQEGVDTQICAKRLDPLTNKGN